ncbi:tetratricopeptide repeat protein [Argonema galeatum]|uniref:tetratricopeptide repeat protein n=1 Tax=Argonema galeatum TaxID=2942762 RepID=UPI002012CC96|nr:tetratricopeptide repeat protein [Argonema galeatum]MCL1466916.1 tetratricopeptide repeat protein [Argonema galeatum A003/A1]
MIDRVAAAFESKDYREAARLLKQLVKESPENPWVQFYVARLHEVTGKSEAAEKKYRQLLRSTTIAKIMAGSRQGLQRLEQNEKQRRKEAIVQAKIDPNNTQLGVLILEPIDSEAKTQAAKDFARIMNLDPYKARLLLPSRGWRLYRTGAIGELRLYAQELLSANIPNFCATLADIQKINVFRVSHFQSLSPQPTIVCYNDQNQMGSFGFKWSEVRQVIQARLPIFEEVVDHDFLKRLERKVKTQDYSQFCDLHLPGRRSILRIYDSAYEFQQGIDFSAQAEMATNRRNWNRLIEFLNSQLPHAKLLSDFTQFAETALDRTELLDRLPSHIELLRRADSHWDPAFQLYSGLVFLRYFPSSPT